MRKKNKEEIAQRNFPELRDSNLKQKGPRSLSIQYNKIKQTNKQNHCEILEYQ